MDSFLTRLSACDTCDVSDALDRLDLPPAISGLAPRTVARRIAGRALTVRLSAGPAPAGSARHLCTAAVDAGGAGHEILVEQRTGIDAAGWGGILSHAAGRRGIEGAIIDGPARDIDEAVGIEFPVYARSVTARTARGRIHEAETGGPITFGEQTAEPGDYVLADRSAVVVIPQAAIEDVLDAVEAIKTKELAMLEALNDGQPVSSVMGADYEHLLEKTR